MSNTDTTTVATTDSAGLARTADGTLATPGTEVSKETTTSSTETAKVEGTETKSTDGKTVLNQKVEEAKKEEKAATGAPEKYEDYKLPEGFKLDPEVRTKADAVFKELGIPQEGAQKLVDMYRELTTEAQAAPYKAYQAMTADWLKQAQDHPDLRGKLAPGGEVNVRIGKMLDGIPDAKLASDFREAMDLTGVGNHPAFIRLMDHVAKQLTEGTHVAGNGPSKGGQVRPGDSAQPGAAAAMWPTLPSAADRR